MLTLKCCHRLSGDNPEESGGLGGGAVQHAAEQPARPVRAAVAGRHGQQRHGLGLQHVHGTAGRQRAGERHGPMDRGYAALPL